MKKHGNIRLVVTDLDGTLLEPDHSISERAILAIQAWKQSGGLFSFITGRPATGITEYAATTGVNAPVICCNGAEIMGTQESGLAIRHGMELTKVRALMEQADAKGMTVLYYMSETGAEYAMSETDWVAVRKERGKIYPVIKPSEDLWKNGSVQKINIMSGGHEKEFLEMGELLEPLKSLYTVTVYKDQGCEIVPDSCNKASGLKELVDHLGIPMDQVMAIGDNMNDLEMLKEAGIGVVVGNAVEEAKEKADYICTEQFSAGVAEAIETFCLGERKIEDK